MEIKQPYSYQMDKLIVENGINSKVIKTRMLKMTELMAWKG